MKLRLAKASQLSWSLAWLSLAINFHGWVGVGVGGGGWAISASNLKLKLKLTEAELGNHHYLGLEAKNEKK